MQGKRSGNVLWGWGQKKVHIRCIGRPCCQVGLGWPRDTGNLPHQLTRPPFPIHILLPLLYKKTHQNRHLKTVKKADQATLDKEGSGRVDRSLEDNGKQWRASNDRQLWTPYLCADQLAEAQTLLCNAVNKGGAMFAFIQICSHRKAILPLFAQPVSRCFNTMTYHINPTLSAMPR